MARFTYNPRTGVLSGLQGISIGSPAQSIEQYVTSYISNNTNDVYDSDLVISTILKNLDIAALSSGGGSGSNAGIDSEAIINLLFNEGYVNNFQLTLSSDSDRQELRSEALLIRNDLDSESGDLRSKINDINAALALTIDSSTVATFVGEEIDNRNLLDSDGAISILNEFGLLDSDQVVNMINEHYDSDAIVQTAIKGFNVAAASYDSDRTVQTINKNIDIAALSNINTTAIDSEEVYNMGIEHGWFYDSDKVMSSVTKNTINIINIVNNNLGKLDSDFVFQMLDSEEVLNMFAEHGIATDTAITGLKADLDSETARIQLLLSNADSDQIAIAILRRDADSDSAAIQAIKTQAAIDAAHITLIRADLDSDTTAIQALRTDMDSESARINARLSSIESDVNTTSASNTVQNGRISSLEARADSDESVLQLLDGRINTLENAVSDTGFDSDQVVAIINENVAAVTGIADSDLKAVADLRNDLDSDFEAFNTRVTNNFDSIQTLNSTTNSQGGRLTSLEASRDSESAKVQTINSTVATLQSTQNAYGGRISSLEQNEDSDTTVVNTLRNTVASLRSDIDSETSRIQLILLSQDSDALSIAGLVQEADSDAAAIAELLRQADSDAAAIQALKTDLTADITSLQTRADSDEIAISARLPLAGGTMSGDIDGNGNKVLFANVYANLVDLPNASTYHGMFAHVHATGAGYFAHGGNWIRIANHSDLYNDASLRADLDSDSIKIQAMQESIDSLVAGTYNDAPIVARLDSDTLAISALRNDVDGLNSLSKEDSDIINLITGARLVDTVQVIGGAQTDVDSFLANDIRAAKYIVVVSSDSDSTYQTDELLVVHDGSAAYVTQYGQINTADSELATFDASFTAGSVYLKATGTRNNIRFDAQRLQVNVANGSIIINGVSSLVVDSDNVGTYAASFGNETKFNTSISRDPSNGGTNADLMTTRLAAALQDECDNFPANSGNLQYGHFVFYNNGSPVYDFCAGGIPSIFNNRLNPGDITVTSSNNSIQSTFRVSFPTNLVFSPQFGGTTYNPSQWTAGNQGNTEFDEFRLYLNNNTTGVTEGNSTLAFSTTVAALTAP